MASHFSAAIQREVTDQSPWRRYKGSFLIVASGLAWVLSDLARSPEIAELGWSTGIGLAATIAAFIVNRFTRDGVTPSQAEILERAGERAYLDRVSVSNPQVQDSYEGQHRAQE